MFLRGAHIIQHIYTKIALPIIQHQSQILKKKRRCIKKSREKLWWHSSDCSPEIAYVTR